MMLYGLHLLEGKCAACGQFYVKRALRPMKAQTAECWKCSGTIALFKMKHWGRYVNVMESGTAVLIDGNI